MNDLCVCGRPDEEHGVANCPSCGQELQREKYTGTCPSCESKFIPTFPCHDRSVTINWRDLRCLVMWAEFWGNSKEGQDGYMVKTVHHIARRLQAQHPEMQALTFAAEVRELREAFPNSDVQVYGAPDEEQL